MNGGNHIPPRYYVASRAAHPGYCVIDRETGLAVLDGLTKTQAEIEAAWRNDDA